MVDKILKEDPSVVKDIKSRILEKAKIEYVYEKLSKSEYKDKKEKLIDLIWTYDKGNGFNSKEDIYKEYKYEIDMIV